MTRALGLALFVATAAGAQGTAWRQLMTPPLPTSAVCSDAKSIFAVGERVHHSRDGGATWQRGPAIAGSAVAVACRKDAAFIATATGGVFRSDGTSLEAMPLPRAVILGDVAAGGALVIAVGERGGIFVARDGGRFVAEPSGTQSFVRRVLVDGERAFAVAEDGAVYARDGGRWRRHVVAKGVPLAAIVRDGDGLGILATDGRIFHGDGKRFTAGATLPIGARGHCDDLAVAGKRVVASCARATGNPLAMEPPMESIVLVSDGGAFTVDAAPKIARLFAAGDAVYAAGAGVLTIAAPTP